MGRRFGGLFFVAGFLSGRLAVGGCCPVSFYIVACGIQVVIPSLGGRDGVGAGRFADVDRRSLDTNRPMATDGGMADGGMCVPGRGGRACTGRRESFCRLECLSG